MEYVSLLLPLGNPKGSFKLIKPLFINKLFYLMSDSEGMQTGEQELCQYFWSVYPLGSHKIKGIKI